MALTFKKKAAVLSALVVVLAAVYILTLVFDPENRRGDSFAWLDPSLVVMADGIEIYGPEGKTELRRKNNVWFVMDNAAEWPVKQERVRDFFALLTMRDSYSRRVSSREGIEGLGLTEDRASRIIVRGGVGLPLLDLLVGLPDAVGREIYLRRTGWNQIYSADDNFSQFTESKPASWYDLRLFPEISVEAVQQTEVSLTGMESYLVRRSGRGWIIPGNESVSLDSIRIDAWLRWLIEAEGEAFAPNPPEVIEGTITFRLGDGSTRTLQAGPIYEQRTRLVMISGSPFVYVLPEHMLTLLLRPASFFFNSSS